MQQKLQENVQRVRAQMEQACNQAGRDARSVLLCAASKTQTAETVALAAPLDIDVFGENRVQELVQKTEAGAYGQKPRHLIGQLQTNKVKQIIGCGLIHSVDSDRLVQKIEQEAEKAGLVQPILLEVNLAGEQTKAGVSAQELPALVELALGCPHLQLRGLMTIPPPAESEASARRVFAQMWELDQAMQTQYKEEANAQWDTLSMGMSRDFAYAILEGATLVRVGTAIFGARAYPV